MKFFDWVQSLQTQAYKDNFHGKLVKLENGFSQIFYLQCHSKNQYKSSAWMLVRCGSWNFDEKFINEKIVRKWPSVWMCRHIFTWSWISMYGYAIHTHGQMSLPISELVVHCLEAWSFLEPARTINVIFGIKKQTMFRTNYLANHMKQTIFGNQY